MHTLPKITSRHVLAFAALQAAVTSLTAQQPFQTLPRHGLPAAPVSNPLHYGVVTGDFDGDGDQDVMIAEWSTVEGQDRLLRNDGRGRFTDVTATHMPQISERSRDLAIGDIDDDGDLDAVVVVQTSGQSIKVLVNDGQGSFTELVQAATFTTEIAAIALGDVDGDGDLDAVLAGSDLLLRNDGTGQFAHEFGQVPSTAATSSDVVLGDFDGDGDLDMARTNHDDPGLFYPYVSIAGTTELFLNDGAGSFTDVTSTNMAFHSAFFEAIVAGDFDRDGDLDMAIAGKNFSLIYGFSDPTAVRLLINDGSGSFAQTPLSTANTNHLALGDIDEDGDLDIVTGAYDGPSGRVGSTVLRNDGGGTFTDISSSHAPPAVTTYACTLADVDGDADLDWIELGYDHYAIHVNVQHQLHAPSAPAVGQPYDLDAYLRVGPGGPADLAAIWLSTAAVNVPIPALGTLGIDPNAAVPFPAAVIAAATGIGSVQWNLPNNAALAGVDIYSQAVIIDNLAELRLSNVVAETIGP